MCDYERKISSLNNQIERAGEKYVQYKDSVDTWKNILIKNGVL